MGSFVGGRFGALVALMLWGGGVSLQAQVVMISDDFNDGNDVGWTRYAPVATPPFNAAAEWTFPTDPSGGFRYRIFGGPPDDDTGGPTRVGSFRNDAVFNDFFQSVDLLGYVPIQESVAFLAGRITTPGFLTTKGYLIGYIDQGLSANQAAFFTLGFDSELTVWTPDFYHGGLAILPNLATNGQYRMTFTGTGPMLRGALYHRTDLLEPLVRIAAFDTTNTSGTLGVGVLNLNDDRATDYTFDNYYSTGQPNTPPAFLGVAQVSQVTPLPNTLFYSPTGGITFRVRTFTTNQINTNSIQLIVNGSNVTSQITITDQAVPLIDPPRAHYLCRYAQTLPSNRIVQATIVVNDTAGRGTTNNWTFDTFTTDGIRIIEAEDYNYGGGQYIDEPPVSGIDSNGGVVGPDGYYNRAGMLDVDYHDNGTSADPNENQYRPDFMSTTQDRRETRDTPRADHQAAGVGDYQVWELQADEWLNYTRSYEPGRYFVYVRASSQAPQRMRFDEVISDPRQPNQSLIVQGVLAVPNTGSSTRFRYVPVGDAFGNAQAISVNGLHTFRLTAQTGSDDLQLNYLLFVPAPAALRSPWVVSVTPTPGSTTADPETQIQAQILDAEEPVIPESIMLFFDGSNVTQQATIELSTPEGAGATVYFRPGTVLPPNSQHTAKLIFGDGSGVFQTNEWSFSISNMLTVPASFALPVQAGTRGFNGRIAKARNDAPDADFANSSARAEAQLAGTIIDAGTGSPYVNQAAGPNGDGSFAEGSTINYEQAGSFQGFFGGERPFPNINPADYANDPDFIAMATTTFLELAPGVYRFGVRSDDGFKVTAGDSPTNQTLLLGVFEGGRGSSATEFEFYVMTNGLYAFRLLFYEGRGGADVEWYSVNRTTGVRTLINETGGVRAYRSLGALAPMLSIAPGGGNAAVSFATTAGRTYTLEARNALGTGSWSPLTNGAGTGGTMTFNIPPTNDTRFFRLRVD